jgi:hypothetical protein
LALFLSGVAGLRASEVATRMGRSREAAESLIRRAKEKFRAAYMVSLPHRLALDSVLLTTRVREISSELPQRLVFHPHGPVVIHAVHALHVVARHSALLQHLSR